MKAMVYYELKDYEFAWESIEKAFSLDNDNEWTINKRRDIFDKLNQIRHYLHKLYALYYH